MTDPRRWKEVIRPDDHLFTLNLREIWQYRDLLGILVRRDVLAIYKQTILGPIWFFLQPVLTTIVYVLVFSRAAGLSTEGMPPILFYLSGLVLWGYFSECILRTSSQLRENAPIMSKVYFPRLILPLSLVATNLVKFGIQLGLLAMVYLYFLLFRPDMQIQPNLTVWMLPVYIILTGLLGLGMGLIISAMTTKYKDLMHLVGFGVQLLMFTSPVIFPLSSMGDGLLSILIKLNPMTGIIEAFRYGLTGKGSFNPWLLSLDALMIAVFLLAGLLAFNKIQRSFIDTI